ncbi:VPLPA-CTERM-specific exosortase XrtD [uncultured Amaricoccus sp.]|uniref:VPLPA-CTERM-specific exosortase XrtD n=1 Tax=uncultured Amaricoccus sp. TaxID=339341 RepID=UPI00260F6D44|nr:VPLPA-CTERM-specific exosortase XrtD [uncultured Amaricoccus sp.]
MSVSTREAIRNGAIGNGGALAFDPAGLFWFTLCLLAALPLFWFGLTGLASAWARPEYSHGPIIPLLSFYMYLREMKAVPPPAAPVTDRTPGVLVLGGALLLALLGNLARIDDLVFYALILWIFGLILTCYGARRGVVFWPSVLHLVFMLPLPQFLYWKLNTNLQFLSSEIGVWLVALTGAPVFLDGNIIDLGVYKLQVAEACSGLRYLFPIMSFSYVFAVLYRGPLWHRLALLVAAAPLAVLMNALRIGMIGFLVDRHGIAQAEGFLHFFEGWIIFLGCVGLLFALAVALRRLSGDRRPLAEAIDLDFSGLREQLARVLTISPSRGLIAAALLTTALSAAWALAPHAAPAPPARDPFALFPNQIGGWSGTRVALDPAVERNLGADDYLAAWYHDPAEAEPVDLFLSYYLSQTEGEAIHSPEVCLPAGGWEVFSIEPTTVTLPAGETVRLNRAIIQKGLEKQLVYYWFEGRGRRLTSEFAAKFQTFADGVTRGRTDGGLVRVITPIDAAGVAAADARLTRFLGASLDRLHRFVPE